MFTKEILTNFLLKYKQYLGITNVVDDNEFEIYVVPEKLMAHADVISRYVKELNEILAKNISSFSLEEIELINIIINVSKRYHIQLLEGEPEHSPASRRWSDLENDGIYGYKYEYLVAYEFDEFKLFVLSKITELIKLYLNSEDKSLQELKYFLPEGKLPDDITEIINLTYSEIIEDYKNKCYISAIALCGKVIETVLTSLFIRIFKEDPDKKGLGFNAMVNRLKKEKNFEFKELESQMSLISAHRNKAIHGSIIIPTQDEARGIISLTKDVMLKVISKT